MQGGTIVLFVALAVAGGFYGGKAAWKHVVKPAGCGVTKAVTLGHKHCKQKNQPTQQQDGPAQKAD
jgi:hypothetical protein